MELISVKTSISFILAPIVEYMSLKNETSDDLLESQRPKRRLQLLTTQVYLFFHCRPCITAGFYFLRLKN